MPARTPWFKGTIERHFRTTNTGLVHMLPGTTFAPFAAYGASPPAQQACISLTAFWHVLHVFLLDVYAERWHRGMEAIPSERWRAAVAQGFVPVLPRSAEDVRILLCSTEERMLQRIGIQFETLRYQSTDLARLRSATRAGDRVVRIKYDPGNLGAIYVQDPTEHGHWLSVPAVNQDYAAGLSMWKHRLIRRAVTAQRQAVDIAALAAAKHQLQALVEQEFRQTRSLQTRKRAARYREVGTGPLPSTGMAQDHAPAHSGSPTALGTTAIAGQLAHTPLSSMQAGGVVTPKTDDGVDGPRSLSSVPGGDDDADLARIRAEFGGDFGLRGREDDG